MSLKRFRIERAFSLFPTVFSKGMFPWGSKGVIVWEWVKGYIINLILDYCLHFLYNILTG